MVMMDEKLREAVANEPDLLRSLIAESYNDLAESINVLNRDLPSLAEVTQEIFTALGQVGS